MISLQSLPFIYDQPIYRINSEKVTPTVKPVAIAHITTLDASNDSTIESISEIASKPIEKMIVKAKVDTPPDTLLAKTEKNIWLMVSPENGETLSTEEYGLLNKTMEALKLSSETVSIFVPQELVHSYFKELNLSGKIIIDFGMQPSYLCLSPLPLHRVHSVRNSQYLPTVSLTILQNDISMKRDWWAQMKILFN